MANKQKFPLNILRIKFLLVHKFTKGVQNGVFVRLTRPNKVVSQPRPQPLHYPEIVPIKKPFVSVVQ